MFSSWKGYVYFRGSSLSSGCFISVELSFLLFSFYSHYGSKFALHLRVSCLYRTTLWPVWLVAEVYRCKSVVKMHIKSIILEGFKSYAQRTEVNGFDPLFNAITGLNGSGKSNILDSICFLLGISNLSQVKCKLSDLM